MAMKARHRRRWAISLTELVWLLMAATLSDRTCSVLPLKWWPQMAVAITIGINSLMDIWYFSEVSSHFS